MGIDFHLDHVLPVLGKHWTDILDISNWIPRVLELPWFTKKRNRKVRHFITCFISSKGWFIKSFLKLFASTSIHPSKQHVRNSHIMRTLINNQTTKKVEESICHYHRTSSEITGKQPNSVLQGWSCRSAKHIVSWHVWGRMQLFSFLAGDCWRWFGLTAGRKPTCGFFFPTWHILYLYSIRICKWYTVIYFHWFISTYWNAVNVYKYVLYIVDWCWLL